MIPDVLIFPVTSLNWDDEVFQPPTAWSICFWSRVGVDSPVFCPSSYKNNGVCQVSKSVNNKLIVVIVVFYKLPNSSGHVFF